MPRGRRRKIEVPTGNTQPQFELGDTAEDIERRRREREERDERERTEQEERDRERMEREREESLERGEKRVRTDMDTDVESTQSRQKKGQMKSIFLIDSDEEATVSLLNSMRNFMSRPTTVSKTSRRRKDCEELV